MAEEHTEAIAVALAEGLAHLRAGRLELACTRLRFVCTDPAFAAADELRDVRARALSLWSDALLQRGEVEAAAAPVREALSLLSQLEDLEGLEEVRGLWGRVLRAREAAATIDRQRRSAANLRNIAIEELRMRFGDRPLALADALIKKADAEAEGGDPAVGVAAAMEALALAEPEGSVRELVFAHIALARLAPDSAQQHLKHAWHRAERASEFNLVSAVARAAEVLSVSLPVQVGPDLVRSAAGTIGADDDPGDLMG